MPEIKEEWEPLNEKCVGSLKDGVRRVLIMGRVGVKTLKELVLTHLRHKIIERLMQTATRKSIFYTFLFVFYYV